jgi:hypothetical protein
MSGAYYRLDSAMDAPLISCSHWQLLQVSLKNMLMEQSGKNIRRLRKRDAGVSGPYALQRVMVTDQQNTLHLLVYQLVPINQDWRISGVEILAMPGERI